MKKKETEAQARERRKKQYGCDGLCYGGMNDDGVMCQPCGGIDTCEETRYIEAFATWGAALVILLTPIAMIHNERDKNGRKNQIIRMRIMERILR